MNLKFLCSLTLPRETVVGLKYDWTSAFVDPVVSLDSWITKPSIGGLADVIPDPEGITYLSL